MGSQKQSHRVRRIVKVIAERDRFHKDMLAQKQEVINDLIKKNDKLSKLLTQHRSRPKWWQFRAMKNWRNSQ